MKARTTPRAPSDGSMEEAPQNREATRHLQPAATPAGFVVPTGTASGNQDGAVGRSGQSRLGYRIVKRVFDVVFSLLVLVVLCIPGVVLAIAIAVESPGGPVFRQQRVGKNGKEIKIWKFRSMYVDAHEHPERYLNDAQMTQWKREQKVENDPRVTRIGKIIRRTSIDEFPQFVNVVKGDVSVIGPRPVTMAETYEFGEYRDEFLSVRPGITGWWQTTKRNEATWENGQRQALELEYVRHCGFAMDIACFIGTFSAMFGKDQTGK